MIVLEMLVAVVTVVATALPARGVIGRNAVIGIRTRALMRDDKAWQRGHRAAVLPVSMAAVLTVSIGIACIATGRMNETTSVVICAVPILAGAIWGAGTASRAVR